MNPSVQPLAVAISVPALHTTTTPNAPTPLPHWTNSAEALSLQAALMSRQALTLVNNFSPSEAIERAAAWADRFSPLQNVSPLAQGVRRFAEKMAPMTLPLALTGADTESTVLKWTIGISLAAVAGIGGVSWLLHAQQDSQTTGEKLARKHFADRIVPLLQNRGNHYLLRKEEQEQVNLIVSAAERVEEILKFGDHRGKKAVEKFATIVISAMPGRDDLAWHNKFFDEFLILRRLAELRPNWFSDEIRDRLIGVQNENLGLAWPEFAKELTRTIEASRSVPTGWRRSFTSEAPTSSK